MSDLEPRSTHEQDFEDTVESQESGFDMTAFVREIWMRRRTVFFAAAAGCGLFLAFGLVTKRKYTAEVLLMPPDSQSLTTTSMLSGLGANPLAGGLGGGGGLLSTRTPGATVMGIMGSPAVQDPLIAKFNLSTRFHSLYLTDTRKRLTSSTQMSEDKKSGIITVSYTSNDPVLARDIANAYVTYLDAALNNINISAAHQERVFLENRTSELKQHLAQLSEELSKFSTKSGLVNPQAQGQALFESITKIQGELTASESELAGLQQIYSADNVRVRSAQARIASLRAELSKMGAAPDSHISNSDAGDEEPTGKGKLPTLRELPNLGVTFSSLNQQLLTEQTVYATLERQYELSRVEEAKEIPSAKVLAPADLPQRPSSASPIFNALVGLLLFAFLATLAVMLLALIKVAPASMPLKAFFHAIFSAIRD